MENYEKVIFGMITFFGIYIIALTVIFSICEL